MTTYQQIELIAKTRHQNTGKHTITQLDVCVRVYVCVFVCVCVCVFVCVFVCVYVVQR